MAYNPHIKLDMNEIKRLSFDWELLNYVYYSETYGAKLGQLVETDEETLDKIEKILSGEDSQASIKAKDKVYVLPNSPIPKNRIKSFLKSVKATLTTDIDKATVIVGHDNIYDTSQEDQAKVYPLMFQSCEYRNITLGGDELKGDVLETVKEGLENGTKAVMSKVAYYNTSVGYGNTVYKGRSYFMYPITMKILHRVLTKKLPVVGNQYFVDNANSDLDLSEKSVYESIEAMLSSSDDANQTMGAELLINSKVSLDNIYFQHHLWLLAQDHYYKIAGARDKNAKFFADAVDLQTIYYQNNVRFIIEHHKSGILNSEVFKYHLKDIHMECIDQTSVEGRLYEPVNGNIGEIKYELKEEFKKYLND